MITVSDVVSNWVKKSPFLQEALLDGLINTSALARKMMPDIYDATGKQPKLTTIVMALQRMDHGAMHYEGKKLETFFKQLKDLLVRSGLVVYTLRSNSSIIKKLSYLLDCLSDRQEVMCTFSQGVGEYTLILSEVEAYRMADIFDREDIVEVKKSLTAFTLLLPKVNRALSGIYYFILRQLAWHGINVVEVLSTSNEFTIVVENNSSGLTFEVLQGLGKE